MSATAYTATYVYDPLNRLTSATAQGSYTYGDAAHLHAATATATGGYSAVMGYDNERRMVNWQSTPSNPGATATYAYDGEWHGVTQQVTAGGSTTTTYYVAGLEEQANSSGSTSTLTKYYSVPGVFSAVNVGDALRYVAPDALGSVLPAVVLTPAPAASGGSPSVA